MCDGELSISEVKISWQIGTSWMAVCSCGWSTSTSTTGKRAIPAEFMAACDQHWQQP